VYSLQQGTRNNGNNKQKSQDKKFKTHPFRGLPLTFQLLRSFMSNIFWSTFLVTTIVTFLIVVQFHHAPRWITEDLPAQSNLTWTDGKRRNNLNHAWSSTVPEHERNTTYLVHSLVAREISNVRGFLLCTTSGINHRSLPSSFAGMKTGKQPKTGQLLRNPISINHFPRGRLLGDLFTKSQLLKNRFLYRSSGNEIRGLYQSAWGPLLNISLS